MKSSTLMLLLVPTSTLTACGGSVSNSSSTAIEEVSSKAPTAETPTDHHPALAKIALFGDILAEISTLSEKERTAVTCERIEKIKSIAQAIVDSGTPDGISDPSAYQKETARLNAAAAMSATYCERGVGMLPADFPASLQKTHATITAMVK